MREPASRPKGLCKKDQNVEADDAVLRSGQNETHGTEN
jgi:hypothetical protein